MLPSPSLALLLCPTFAAAHSGPTAPFALGDFGKPVPFADGTAPARLAPMHLAMQNRVNRLQVLWTTARVHMTLVVDMLARGAVQRLVNKAVHLLQFPADPHVAVAVTVFGACPNPTLAFEGEAGIEPRKCFMREHAGSIQIPGFNTSADAPNPRGSTQEREG